MESKFEFLNVENYNIVREYFDKAMKDRSEVFVRHLNEIIDPEVSLSQKIFPKCLNGSINITNLNSYDKCKLLEQVKFLNLEEFEKIVQIIGMDPAYCKHLRFDSIIFKDIYNDLIGKKEVIAIYATLLFYCVDTIYNTNIRLQVLNDQFSVKSHQHGYNKLDVAWRRTLKLDENELGNMSQKNIINLIIRESLRNDLKKNQVPDEFANAMEKTLFSSSNASYQKYIYEFLLSSFLFHENTSVSACSEIVFPLIIFSSSSDGNKRFVNEDHFDAKKLPTYKSYRDYCRQKLRALVKET